MQKMKFMLILFSKVASVTQNNNLKILGREFSNTQSSVQWDFF